MNTFLKKIKKHWITIWLVTVSVLLGTFATYAIYTEVSSIKRVVTTKAAPKELFSSNCMYPDLYERRMSSTEFNVNVNNFDPNLPEVPNTADIQYTLTAQLKVKYNGTIMTFAELAGFLGEDTTTYDTIVADAAGYKIGKSQDNNSSGVIASPVMQEFSAGNNFTVTFNGPTGTSPAVNYEVLPGGSVSTDRFKVEIPDEAFEKTDAKFYVYVKADAVDAGLTDLQTLLYGSKNIVVTASWFGTLAESDTDTLDYDFYNYVITGSGSGKLDIMWDPRWFEIDGFFFDSSLSGVKFENDNSTPTDITEGTYNGWKKVTIEVDSSTGVSRYALQLYKVKDSFSYTGTENDAANHIHCEMQQN